MTALYTPRRAGSRWLQDAPPYVLDCFDSRNPGERYTVLFRFPDEPRQSFAETWIAFLGMSGAPTHPQGISQSGELRAHQAAAYRYRFGRHRVRWLDLPAHIRAHVAARVASW